MAEIQTPQVVKFANERIRTAAEQLYRLTQTLESLTRDYDAQGIESLLGEDPSLLIADGSEMDGRPRIDGNHIISIIETARTLLDTLNAEASESKVSRGVMINGELTTVMPTRIQTIASVKVNG